GGGLGLTRRGGGVAGWRPPPGVSRSAPGGVPAGTPAAWPPADSAGDAPDPAAMSIIGADPPAHTRLRSIVSRAFTPRRIADLEPRVREIARDLLARFVPRGECDLVADYAVPLPVGVIAELLGIDRERYADFKRWSDAAMRAVFDSPSPEEAEQLGQALAEMNDYVEQAIAARRSRPGDDLIGTLLRAESQEGALTADEVRLFV